MGNHTAPRFESRQCEEEAGDVEGEGVLKGSPDGRADIPRLTEDIALELDDI